MSLKKTSAKKEEKSAKKPALKKVSESKASKKTVSKAGGAKKSASKKKEDAVNISSDDVLVTKDGLQKLKDELHFLETDRRKQIAKRLEEAISYGDLSENSEYQEAKEEQAFAEGRIIELTRKIKHAKIISDQHAGKVNLGSAIELKNRTLNEKERYTLVGSTEVDPFGGKISNESPVGSAVLGKKKGDVFTVSAPGGTVEYELLTVS